MEDRDRGDRIYKECVVGGLPPDQAEVLAEVFGSSQPLGLQLSPAAHARQRERRMLEEAEAYTRDRDNNPGFW